MAYIGNTVNNQGFTPAIDYFNGDGVTVTFTLSRPVVSVAQMIVAIDNVIQNPSSSFTVSGNSITFTSAPLAGTNNIWVEYTSLITTYNAISQDPSVIGDITATGGFLAVGDFGNTYTDGTIVDYVTGNARITTGPADGITLYNGGTASRTALMAIDSSGNVGIGTASSFGVANKELAINTASGVAGTSWGVAGTLTGYIYSGAGSTFLTSYGAYPLLFGTNNTERMRINSSGNVGIGVTPSAWATISPGIDFGSTGGLGSFSNQAVIAYNTYYNGSAFIYKITAEASAFRQINGAHVFETAPSGTAGTTATLTERVRIDSSGNFMVGKTNASATINGFAVNPNGQGANIPSVNLGSASNSAAYLGYAMYYNNNVNQWQFYVDWNGTISARSTSIAGLSDAREKKNIKDLETGLAEVMQLQPKRFDWKDDSKTNLVGFIAQEVQKVLPDLVENYRVEEGQEERFSLRTGDILPTLVKAIQEQQAIIEDLKARIETLEAK